MTSIQCSSCDHFLGVEEGEDGKAICKAFNPDTKIKHIPQKIINGIIKHNKPIKNQENKIIFKELLKK